MGISPAWTEAERLEAIAFLAMKLQYKINKESPRRDMWRVAARIRMLATLEPTSLEANRRMILEELDEEQ